MIVAIHIRFFLILSAKIGEAWALIEIKTVFGLAGCFRINGQFANATCGICVCLRNESIST